jgi:8-oxo-dGTP pyrophosphatase MutT (NUDIX family)
MARVSERYRLGHDGEPPVLFGDQRLEGVTSFRAAAVLVAITDRAEQAGGPGVLLLHRPSDMRAHPGQIAFPGGKIDAGETPIAAALREAWEELGIEPELVHVIGESDLYKTHSGFAITPVLGIVPSDITIVPNPAEVAQWFEAPLGFVLDPANHRQQTMEWEGAPRTYYEIDWQGHQIWGVTAAMLVNLSRRLRWHD